MAQISSERQTPSTIDDMAAAGYEVPPPTVYGGAFIAGLALNRIFPIPFLPSRIAQITGRFLALSGLALSALAVREMRRAGNSPNPNVPVRAMVETGPFRYTRNPIYLGMSLAYVGASFLAGALWPLLLLPAVLYQISQGMIYREERYLRRRFGERYESYRARVRRWV